MEAGYHVYFESSSLIITFVCLGEYLLIHVCLYSMYICLKNMIDRIGAGSGGAMEAGYHVYCESSLLHHPFFVPG